MDINIIIAGDENKITLTLKKYERIVANNISDLNWISALVNAEFPYFKSYYTINLTTFELKYLYEQVHDFLNRTINEINYETEEGGIGITITSNSLGNLVVKGFLKNTDYGRIILNYEFESNISYLEQTKKHLEIAIDKFKIKE